MPDGSFGPGRACADNLWIGGTRVAIVRANCTDMACRCWPHAVLIRDGSACRRRRASKGARLGDDEPHSFGALVARIRLYLVTINANHHKSLLIAIANKQQMLLRVSQVPKAAAISWYDCSAKG